MEIKYSNFDLDSNIYAINEINGIIDLNGTYIYDNIYDIQVFNPSSKFPVGFFLKSNLRMRKTVSSMLSELEISKDVQSKNLKKLSSSELIKILIIKLCCTNAKVIILECLDTYLCYKDMVLLLKTIKGHLKELSKTVIVTTNKVDNLIEPVDKYIVVENGAIAYNGKDYTKIGVKTDIVSFTELANSKGANLKEYKEANDLLKAIYRSVK